MHMTVTSRIYRIPPLASTLNLLAYDPPIFRSIAKNRKPLGYIDVALLKKKWEAGEAEP